MWLWEFLDWGLGGADGEGIGWRGGRGRERVLADMGSYLAFPGHVVGFVAAAVEGDEEVGAAVAVGEGKFGVGHLFAGRRCAANDDS